MLSVGRQLAGASRQATRGDEDPLRGDRQARPLNRVCVSHRSVMRGPRRKWRAAKVDGSGLTSIAPYRLGPLAGACRFPR